MPKIKNIIIFVAIGAALVLIYVFFIKPDPDIPVLVSSIPNPIAQNGEALNRNSSVAGEFLNLLLNVKNIKLDDAIFSDDAFNSLHDSSITLIPDATEGRSNPFAPIGSDKIPITTSPSNEDTSIPIGN